MSAVETRWRTDEVPGRVAKRTQQTFRKGKEMKEAATVEEVIEFGRK